MENPRTLDVGVNLRARKIWVDVPCRECRHSLRGLELTSVCRNCHTPVARSLRGDPERYLEPPPPLTPAEVLDKNGCVHVDLPCRGLSMSIAGLAIAYLRYLAELAQRIPQLEMVQRARGIARNVLTAAGVLLGLEALDVVLGPGTVSLSPPGATSRPVGQPLFALLTVGACVGSVAALALFVLSISAIRLQWRLCKALREQAELARKNWAGNDVT
jgi:hypothetical protein